MPKYYSIYDRRTDEPVLVHANALKCAERLGVTPDTFYSYVSRERRGKKGASKRYEIIVDEEDEEDEMDSR